MENPVLAPGDKPAGEHTPESLMAAEPCPIARVRYVTEREVARHTLTPEWARLRRADLVLIWRDSAKNIAEAARKVEMGRPRVSRLIAAGLAEPPAAQGNVG